MERVDLERERRALREVFARRALERVRQGSRSPVRYDHERFALMPGGEEGGSYPLNLHNFFGAWDLLCQRMINHSQGRGSRSLPSSHEAMAFSHASWRSRKAK